MKSKLLLLTILMLLSTIATYSQTTASASGIAVQGIARNGSNTALINKQIKFTFTIYYKSGGDQEVHSEDATITTDAFGVFSHVIDIPAAAFSKFSNKILWLKIKDEVNEISNEVFKHVPYAIAANNGAPTGSIMPYIGTDAPEGWAICDGRVLTSIAGSEELSNLLPTSRLPDLRGMFLRGTGTNDNTNYSNNVGPALNSIQGDGIKSHLHEVDLIASGAGAHNHDIIRGPLDNISGVTTSFHTLTDTGGTNEAWGSINGGENATSTEPNHTHPVKGNTKLGGIVETRPVNYGINYIIKL
ncbi:tail fiber protein [Polaribacter sp. 20A6]|uniref:tail fiber protein n=1 Tax=Polaribacter sp. 20A6 TaxID=2687289 RepID=UPI0013FD560D|nr:tail fiber protein [Polaribacter sp. 20A6]